MDGGKWAIYNLGKKITCKLKLDMPVSNDKARIPVMAQNSFFMQKYE